MEIRISYNILIIIKYRRSSKHIYCLLCHHHLHLICCSREEAKDLEEAEIQNRY